MKTMKKMTTAAMLAAVFAGTTALAEFRVWTDVKGKTIEAEQVEVLNSQVVLRLVNNREIRVSLDSLSADDRRLAMLSRPPALEIEGSAETEHSSSTLYQGGSRNRIQIEKASTAVTVNVLKTSAAVYEEPLKAVIYVMGQRGEENGVVLDKLTKTFSYTGTESEFTFLTDEYTSETRGDSISGDIYKGWFAAVYDSNGKVVAMKGSAKEFEENAAVLAEMELGTGADTVVSNRRL